MAPPIKKLAMSFHELMEGVGLGHKKLAQQPGAKRLPAEVREQPAGTRPLDVLNKYNEAEVFKTPQGEVLRARVNPLPTPLQKKDEAWRAMANADLPLRGEIQFVNPRTGDSAGSLDFRSKDLSHFIDDPAQVEMFHQMTRDSTAGGRPVRAYGFDTTAMPEGIGRDAYQMAWDMLRAGGDMNTIDILTGVNQMRRPGNAMSYGLAHGDYRGMPLFPGSKMDQLPFQPSGVGGVARYNAEDEALKRIVLDRAGRPTAEALDARMANTYSDDAKTGLLALKELQMAKAHGVAPDGMKLGQGYMFEQAHPMDPDMLRDLTERMRKGGTGADRQDRYGPYRGYGPGLIGRSGTTEALLGGLQQGLKVDEIVDELLKYPGAFDALRGRYAGGGLVSALQA